MTNRVHVMTFLVVLVLADLAQGQNFTTLYNFTGGSDGGTSYAGVIQDPAGNPYGTTSGGGDLNCNAGAGCGVVFKVNTAGAETVLHTFTEPDGPPNTPMARDKAGNIYGTSPGAVFKIDTAGTYTVLHNLGSSDGCNPYQGLIVDKSGTLYGTAYQCGSAGFATIFKVDHAGNFTLLHTFTGGPSDGAYPSYGHLTMDNAGNLYGATEQGGSSNHGVLYKLTKSGTFTLLHSFAVKDGCHPYGSVVRDKAGNLYGVTNYCGAHSYGTVWRMSDTGKETILHQFAGGASDGCYAFGGVARDSTGNLYGLTESCGANNFGVLYELSARGRLTLLHNFDYSHGAVPVGEVLQNSEGTLFGTTVEGSSTYGTVWKYAP